MGLYNNLKISTKLITGFIIVALIAGAIGLVGITNIRNIDHKYSDMYERYGVALGDIGKVATEFQQQSNFLRQIILEKGVGSSSYIENINELDKEIDDNLNLFQKNIISQDVQKEFDNLHTQIEKFKPIRENVINLAKSNQTDAALQKMNSDATPVATAISDSINKLVNDKINGGRQNSDEYTGQTISTITTMTIIVIIAIIMAILLGILISRIIANPIKLATAQAKSMANGDYTMEIADRFTRQKDEIGMLAKAYKEMIDHFNDVMENIREAAEQVAVGSKQVSQSSVSLSQGASEQASTVEQLSASIEEISSQTKMNASSANEANQLAENAKTHAVNGNEQMKNMLKAMDEINEASASISKIIKVIDDIAFQTNILALNAAVEAARAGQHGKGFAVVAEEVRNLAARSADAAKETTAMIEGSIRKVEGGTKIANQTASALNMIVEQVAKAALLVNNIAYASNEQATGIAQVSQGLTQVSSVVQSNSSTSEESAAASEELSSQAELLKEQVNRFKLKGSARSGVIETGAEYDGKKTAPKAKKKQKNKIELSDGDFGKY